MTKAIARGSDTPHEPAAEVMFLRQLAGHGLVSKARQHHHMRHRIVDVQRDEFGRVIGSTERLEEIEFYDEQDGWTK